MASTSDADWAEYYRQLSGRPPRPLALRAAELAPAPGLALDLGCGDGTETQFLLKQGWRVIAVDLEPAAVELTRNRTERYENLTVEVADLVQYTPDRADLILASATLPFIPAGAFSKIWEKLLSALNPHGLLAVHLFGDRDSWAAGENAVEGMTFHTRRQVEDLLQGLEILRFQEDEFDGGSGRGPKHWHRFEVIARRSSVSPRSHIPAHNP